MDPNSPNYAGPREPPPPLPTVVPIAEADGIVLNVLSPSSEVPGGRITFPRIHLDTKLSQLKTRLRNVLQAAPAPERQRLIYRGHALLNADATLRQVLRPQGSTEPHSDTYTLHLVLPPGAVPAQPVPAPAQPPIQNQAPAGLPQPPLQPGVLHGFPNMPGVQLPHQVLAQAQASQMMLQNQLNMLQQELAGHNHQHPQLVPHQHQQVHPHHTPSMPGTNMPNGMNVTYQIDHQGQPGQQMPMPPGFGFGLPNAAAIQAMMQQQQQMLQHAVGGHQPLPTPGQPMANQLNTETPDTHNQGNASAGSNNELNGANASQQLPVTTRVQESTGPQGQRIRTVVQEVNMTYTSRSRRGTPNPAVPQLNAGASSTPSPANTPGMNVPGLTGIRAPSAPASQGHMQPTRTTPLPFMMPSPTPTISAGSSTAMAWVLSSPNGPEALLFAPGHGYFRSTPQSAPGRPHARAAREHGQAPNLAVIAQAPPQPGQAAAAPLALARLPHANAVPDAQPAGVNDFFNFILGRGWLFLRMYVFTFFISEPSSWRRYILLAVATFICMLPRENFLQQIMTQIRRHIDTLIGPPTAAPRDGEAAAAPANGVPAAPGAAPPAANPTPAGNAARLVREHEARHPNAFRDALFRVERAAAMFLASLVPGVGERHVRAREDLRREAERLENERRAREEAERAQVQTGVDASQIGGAEAGTTAVETRGGTEEARERTAPAQAVETGA